jgi:acyl-coenzyme A synthetase/AMP-(fatty) acid ligase
MLCINQVEADNNGKYVTYGDLLSKAQLRARRLIGQGCRRNDVIAIYAPNSIDWIVSVLAIWRIGAVTAAINSLLTAGLSVASLINNTVKHICQRQFMYRFHISMLRSLSPYLKCKGNKKKISFLAAVTNRHTIQAMILDMRANVIKLSLVSSCCHAVIAQSHRRTSFFS